MAFIEDNFGPVGAFHGRILTNPFDGMAVYSYITTDTLAVVKAGGYFNDLRDQVYNRDVVYVSSNQPTADSFNNEYTIIMFNFVARSPATTNVSVDSQDINAA